MRSMIYPRACFVALACVCLTVPLILAGNQVPLRVVVASGMNGLDPHAESTAVGLAILGNIYDPLLNVDSEGRQTPILALSVERVGDRTWRFQLRQGVKFHNGAPFSSADVVASILRARDNPRSISRVVLQAVAGVVAEGPYGVRVELRKRDAIFLERLSEVRITPKDAPEEIVTPIGTGPYRFVRGQLSSGMTLQAFGGYWGPPPSEKSIELSFDVDGTTGLRKLLANQADLVANLRPSEVREIEARDDLWVDSSLGNLVLFVALNTKQPPFDNSLVREALDCAVDRQALADEIFLRYARPVSQIVSASARGYASSVPPVARDLARAKALIAAVSGEKGISFSLKVSDVREDLARVLEEQLGEAGFHVELVLQHGSKTISEVRDGLIQAGVMAYRSPIADSGSTFSYMVHSQSPGSFKIATSTPDIDRLIEASQDTLDPKGRLALLSDIAERLAQRRGLVPLVSIMDLYGARRELQWKPGTGWALPLATAFRQQTSK